VTYPSGLVLSSFRCPKGCQAHVCGRSELNTRYRNRRIAFNVGLLLGEGCEGELLTFPSGSKAIAPRRINGHWFFADSDFPNSSPSVSTSNRGSESWPGPMPSVRCRRVIALPSSVKDKKTLSHRFFVPMRGVRRAVTATGFSFAASAAGAVHFLWARLFSAEVISAEARQGVNSRQLNGEQKTVTDRRTPQSMAFETASLRNFLTGPRPGPAGRSVVGPTPAAIKNVGLDTRSLSERCRQ